MQRLLGYGVDGMFTNFPERLDPLLPVRWNERDGAKAAAADDRACHARVKRDSVGGTVPATLSLTMGAPASFGAFLPGVGARVHGVDDRQRDLLRRRRHAVASASRAT